MATLETKYSVGEVVWLAGTNTETRQHPCPDCGDEKKWTAISPAGKQYEFSCPRCSASYLSDRDLSLKYSAYAPYARKLTIGSIRVDTDGGVWGDDCPVSYMCRETGVGSGSVYKETDLFATEAEALKAAENKAAVQNANTEWISKLYDKTLELSDYQLENAALQVARRERSNARSFLWNIGNLFATIEEAADKDAVLEAIDDYKSLDWEDDKREAGFAEAGASA